MKRKGIITYDGSFNTINPNFSIKISSGFLEKLGNIIKESITNPFKPSQIVDDRIIKANRIYVVVLGDEETPYDSDNMKAAMNHAIAVQGDLYEIIKKSDGTVYKNAIKEYCFQRGK